MTCHINLIVDEMSQKNAIDGVRFPSFLKPKIAGGKSCWEENIFFSFFVK